MHGEKKMQDKKEEKINEYDYNYDKWHVFCVLTSEEYREQSITLFFKDKEKFSLPCKNIKSLYKEAFATRRNILAFIALLKGEIEKLDEFIECIKISGVGFFDCAKKIEIFRLKG